MNHDLSPLSPVLRRLPQPAAAAFFWWPLKAAPEMWQQALYEWALHEARAVAAPSLLERDLLAVWN